MKKEKNIVLLLEDEDSIRELFELTFNEQCKNASMIVTKTREEYFAAFEEHKKSIKCLIMDLNNDNKNTEQAIKSTIEIIVEQYNNNRIPIFVHSGNLANFTDLDEKGTVIKKEKTRNSIQEIVDSIELMLQSGFFDIFSVDGSLEKKIMREIHAAFINQFKPNDIDEIIKSVKCSLNGQDDILIERATEIFERIAIRSLYSNLLSAKQHDDNIVEVKLNSIEHYYRRTSDFLFWTGDIFKHKESKTLCIILTPRCNIGHQNFDELLLCKISDINQDVKNEFLKAVKGVDAFRKSITDDKKIGERHRFLPPSPQFEGGFVDYKTMFSLNVDDFKEKYSYLLSLSDELTNDVVRKFSSYISRGGISETDFVESLFYIKK